MNIEKIVVGCMNCMGKSTYGYLRKTLLKHNRKWLVGRADLYRFYKGRLQQNTKGAQRVVEIQQGLYEYEYFNICFLNNVLALILTYVAEGTIPYINIRNSKGENIWEQFFEQPFQKEIRTLSDKVVLKEENLEVFPAFDEVYSDRSTALWGSLYNHFVRFNKKTYDYMQQEQEEIFQAGRHILGVCCRGTDYTQLKPKGHPIQPDIEDVLNKAAEMMQAYGYNYIYLATEDGKIDQMFRERFPNKILINKRMYYDEIFDGKDLTWIKDVHFERENDDYLKGVEYLSSLMILSKCNALLAGNCGGSQMAVFQNNGAYEHVYMYNLGLYS